MIFVEMLNQHKKLICFEEDGETPNDTKRREQTPDSHHDDMNTSSPSPTSVTHSLNKNEHPDTLLRVYPGQIGSYFDDYRYRGDYLRDLCLYDYSCTVSKRKLQMNNLDKYLYRFSPEHPLHDTHAQHLTRDIKQFKVPSFTGTDLLNKAAKKQYKFETVMLGLFIPWQQLEHWDDNRDDNNPDVDFNLQRSFQSIFYSIKHTLEPRIRFHIENFESLKKSAEDAAIDRKQQSKRESTQNTDLTEAIETAEYDSDMFNEEYPPERTNLDDSNLMELESQNQPVDSDEFKPRELVQSVARALEIIADKSRSLITGANLLTSLTSSALTMDSRTVTTETLFLENSLPSVPYSEDQNPLSYSIAGTEAIKDYKSWLDQESHRIQDRNSQASTLDPTHNVQSDAILQQADTANVEILDGDSIALSTTREQSNCQSRLQRTFLEVSDELHLNKKQMIFLKLIAYNIQFTQPARPIKRINEDPNSSSSGPLFLYLGGEGGTGKSLAIKAVELLMTKLNVRNALEICATTGAAADNIGGSTYHSSLNVNWKSKNLTASPKQLAYWSTKSVLILDEISMLSKEDLGTVEFACRNAKGMKPPP
jgi:hypothetical protein